MKRVVFSLLALIPFILIAQPPAGYYNSATGLNCSGLKTALKTIVTTGHVNQGYTALWNQYQISDVKPREVGTGSTTVIWDIYSDNPAGLDPYNFTPGTGTGGQQDQGSGGTAEGQFYNREHSVPLSWHSGSTSSFSGADYHHVFPTDKKVNSQRANYPYGTVASATWTSLNGSKLGSSAVAGLTGTVFEPIDEYKGDVARAFLYFVTRYQDDMPTWGNNADAIQAFEPNTFPSVDITYLKLMIQWHNLDPVSQKEIDRNNAAYTYQGNRNPFVDHPEYVSQVWNSSCPGLSALPVDIVFFTGKLDGGNILLNWEVATEINLDRYEVERSFNGTEYTRIGSVKAQNSSAYRFNDNIQSLSGRRVYYRLKKVDKDGKFSYSAIFSMHIPLNTKFSISPNPASTVIKLHLNDNTDREATVIITDMAGRTVYNKRANAQHGVIEIPAAGLNNGNYTVKLFINGQQYTQRVLIVK
jgi:endonuclease I